MNRESQEIAAWFASSQGESCCQPGAEGQFLRNRLWMAFVAGMKAGKKIREEEIIANACAALTGRKP